MLGIAKLVMPEKLSANYDNQSTVENNNDPLTTPCQIRAPEADQEKRVRIQICVLNKIDSFN